MAVIDYKLTSLFDDERQLAFVIDATHLASIFVEGSLLEEVLLPCAHLPPQVPPRLFLRRPSCECFTHASQRVAQAPRFCTGRNPAFPREVLPSLPWQDLGLRIERTSKPCKGSEHTITMTKIEQAYAGTCAEVNEIECRTFRFCKDEEQIPTGRPRHETECRAQPSFL